MDYILYIYYEDKKQEIDLNEKSFLTIGTYKKNDIVLPLTGFKFTLQISCNDTGAAVKSNVYMEINEIITKKGAMSPKTGCVVNRSPFVALILYKRQKDISKFVDFTNVMIAKIGRGKNNNIIFSNKLVSENHAVIEKRGSSLILKDLNSTNGTYVNGVKVTEAKLIDGDTVSITVYKIILHNGVLFFKNNGNDLSLNIEEINVISKETGYPYFQRSPHMLYELPTGEVEIQPPPQIGEKPHLILLPLILPALGMLVPAVITAAFSMLYFSIPMALTGIIVAIVNYCSQKKKHTQTEKIRLDKYNQHLNEVTEDLTFKTNQQRDIMNTVHPTLMGCIEITHNIERRLWERIPEEKNFLELKVGTGTLKSSINIKAPRKGTAINNDALLAGPDKIQSKFGSIENMPICVNLLDHPSIGIVGDRKGALSCVQNIIIQTAVNHSYEEVKIVTVFNGDEYNDWSWIRWLPHSWEDSRVTRYMADSKQKAADILKEFEEIFKSRERELNEYNQREKIMELPFILFIIADRHIIEYETIMRYIARNDIFLGIGIIMLFDSISYLPSRCSLIIETYRNSGVMQMRDNAENTIEFVMESVDAKTLDNFARDMAPIRIKSVSADSKLPNCITFLQGYNVKKAGDIPIQDLWDKNQSHKSLDVPIAIKENGDSFIFNILWGGGVNYHGPHGLVAGTTRSGKSELVQTWILSMALHFPPQDVSFVLIDWKGTSLISPFKKLPHIAGTISNIDKKTQRNFNSLEQELLRRQTLFDKYNVNDIKTYKQLYKANKIPESLAYLIIVIDEFAEVKKEIPEFVPALDSIFTKGASLGVFAVIATQDPSSVVTDKMLANTRFRWCLKVSGPLQSKEMIGRADASKITVPGRGYIKVGDDEIFELIQSFWSGAPYNPDAKLGNVSSVKIAQVDLSGKRNISENYEKTIGFNNDISEIDAVVQYLDSFINGKNIGKADAVWTKPLDNIIKLNDILDTTEIFDGSKWPISNKMLTPIIGKIDDPHTQSQYPLKINIIEEGNLAVYGAPQTGKTTFLQTLTVSLALEYTPDEVNIYIMNFGNGELKSLESLPHVGGVAQGSEDEKIRNLVSLISNIISERKKGFTNYRINNIISYGKEINKSVPYIILMVDDFAPVLEQYPELDSFFMNLVRSGSGYGVYFIVTASALSGIGYRISQNIKQSIALQMIDKTDYLQIVGRIEDLDITKTMGRGIIRGKPPLEFQTAYAVEDGTEFLETVQSLGIKMRKAWSGKNALPIPMMPEIVTGINFPEISDDLSPLGLTQDLTPLYITDKNKLSLVSGSEGSGKTNALYTLICQFLSIPETKIYWLDGDSKITATDDIYVLNDIQKIEMLIQDLEILSTSQKEKRIKNPPVVIVIDNFPSVINAFSDEIKMKMDNIVNDCMNTSFYIYISGNYNELSVLYYQSGTILQQILQKGISIVTGGSLSRQKYISPGANISYSEQDTELPEFWGYYTSKGKTVKIKLIQSIKNEASINVELSNNYN